MKAVYISLTGQTVKFVDKLGMESHRLVSDDDIYPIKENYILILPTYNHEGSLELVEKFINTQDNKSFLKGVVGSGNRNFNDLFCISAKEIVKKYEVPLLHCFEFQGEARDVEIVRNEVEKLG